MLAIKTILYPTDFSERSEAAFQLACSLAEDYCARLVILHVVKTEVEIFAEGVLPYVPELQLVDLRDKLEDVQPRNSAIFVERKLVEGNPAEEILHVAEQIKADVIVMATHGRSGLDRVLLGSVAEVVLRGAPCPVLSVRRPVKRTTAAKSKRTPSKNVMAAK